MTNDYSKTVIKAFLLRCWKHFLLDAQFEFFKCFLKVKLSNLIRFDIRCWHLDLYTEAFTLISNLSIMAAIQVFQSTVPKT